MLDAISAEALKFRRHRATWGLVWIWPIGVALILAARHRRSIWPRGAVGPARPAPPAGSRTRSTSGSFPPSRSAAICIGAFVAVVFAGEYGWNTWKLIVPHRARNSLIAAKYVVALALLACGFTARRHPVQPARAGSRISRPATPIPAGIAAGALLQAHGLAALAALAPILLTTAYVSLAAILTRSTVAALVIGLVITTLEQLFRFFAPMLDTPGPGPGRRALSGAARLSSRPISASWIAEGRTLIVPFPSGPFSMAPAASLAIVAAWIARPDRPDLPRLPPPGHQLGSGTDARDALILARLQPGQDRAQIVAGARGGFWTQRLAAARLPAPGRAPTDRSSASRSGRRAGRGPRPAPAPRSSPRPCRRENSRRDRDVQHSRAPPPRPPLRARRPPAGPAPRRRAGC